MSPANNDKPRLRFHIEFLPDLRRAKSRDQQKEPYILVVDDDAKIARLVQANLERHAFRVETAAHGAQALARIRKHRPDVVITDNWMPEMNGYQLLQEIRRDPALRDLPVILIWNKPFDLDEFTSWDMAADMYLPKPFNPAELITFIKRILPPRYRNDGWYGEQSDGSFLIED